MDPLMIDVPERIETDRLIIRRPRPGDGVRVHPAVCESFDSLHPYVPWAHTLPTPEESEAAARRMSGRFQLREDLAMFMFERALNGEEGDFVGGTGLHRIDWTVRRFEIGYWRRTGRDGLGFVTEAVHALTRMAFEQLDARRVEIRMDDDNERSWRVAERAGFTLEGVLRRDSLTPQGEPRDTRVYAKVRGIEVPDTSVGH